MPVVDQERDILGLVDIQNCFMPADPAVPGTGELPVPEGAAVIGPANRLGTLFDDVFASQDWHPDNHTSFAVNHRGKAPFDTIELAYGSQVLWPAHAVQGTPGAEFHPGLDSRKVQLVLRKGFRAAIDSYSAFYENDRRTSTGLSGWLKARGKRRLFLCGLALDFCVAYTAEDGAAEGFEIFVVEDACRGIDIDGSVATTRAHLTARGVAFISTTNLR